MGDILFKRFLLLCVILCIALGGTVYAANYFKINAGNEFLVYGEDDGKLAKALGISEDEFQEYCAENVHFLASNKDNSKQIRLTISENEFTASVVNITNISDDKISQLIPQITGIDSIRGEIINRDGQKFIKTELRSEDSGGEFILTEYITVANKKSFVLSFYTDVGESLDYIEKTFENYSCDYFYSQSTEEKADKKSDILGLIVPAFTIVFGVVAVVVGISLIYELRKRKIKTPDAEQPEEFFMKSKKIGKVVGGQDGAIWNGYFFRFDHLGNCTVYNLEESLNDSQEEFSSVCEFRLDKADIIMPHSNSVSFGNEFFSEDDEFPLLYTNLYNSYADSSDKKSGTTCVYRILRNENNFVSTLVQIIQVGFTDSKIWSSENQADVRPFGNFAIDCENSIYYAFTMRDENDCTRYFSFRLPKVSDGEYDEKYGVNRVVLTTQDIIEKFDCPYQRYIQGAAYRKGLIYSLEGFTDDAENLPAIRIIDVNNKTQIRKFVFSDYGLTIEPEMIEFYNNRCYYSDNDGNLFNLVFR